MKIGDIVRDVYTNRVGHVLAIDDYAGRCTVDVGVYKITGCQSWFKPVTKDKRRDG